MKYHNILIVSASIGSGHMQAAEAVQAELLWRFPNAKITVVDFLEGSNWLELIKKTYLLMLHVLPDAYDILYQQSHKSMPGSKVKNLTAQLMKKRMLGLVQKYCPDRIVFTHPFPCCAAAYLRRTRKINVPIYAVITDFAAHQSWIHDEVTAYFVANTEVATELCRMGVTQERIFVTGIPISPKFTILPKTPQCLKKPLILIMGGGLGLGGIEESLTALSSLRPPVRFIVIAGKNRHLQKRLMARKYLFPHALEIIGFTDRVPELMAEASVLITKPGALTCCEAMATELPLLLFNSLPGQEEKNADYLTRQGAAIKISTGLQLTEVISKLLANDEQTTALRLNARKTARPYASAEIANIIKMQSADTSLYTANAG